jgi:predicted RNA-binding protein with PUA-like domain
LVEERVACWDGVRNYAARKHMMPMQTGDAIFIYHSGKDMVVIGVSKVVKEKYPDPTTDDERWIAVDLEAISKFDTLVALSEIKFHPDLQELLLVRQGRLSVMPIPKEAWDIICTMSQK